MIERFWTKRAARAKHHIRVVILTGRKGELGAGIRIRKRDYGIISVIRLYTIDFEMRRCVYPGRFAMESARLRDWIFEGEA